MRKVKARGSAVALSVGFAEDVEVEFSLEQAITHYAKLMIAQKVRKDNPAATRVSMAGISYDILDEAEC